jgi:hypothetical protein
METCVTQEQENRERWEDEPPSIRASIVVRDFAESPDEISRLLGLQPTRSGRAGEPRINVVGRQTSQTLRRSYWSLHSSVGPREPLAQHVDDLASKVSQSTSAFRRLPSGATVTLFCTIIPNGALPVLTLSCNAMRVLADIGAPVEIDIISVEAAPDRAE